MSDPASCRHGAADTRATGGQCPACLMELGLSHGPATPREPTAPLPGSDAPTVLPGPETVTPLVPGSIVGGRYRIESRLGSGAMGEVWRASDLKLRVDVALKALPSRLVGDEKRREMMRQEVRAAHQVISPNVCRIYDLVEADGQELISMEYIDGVTLSEHLRRAAPLEIREASEIGMQLLAGLEAIHQAGFVHRDVKPENVMLTRAGRVVAMDFGIAKPVSEGEGGTIAGTPAYMAPEQRRGEKPDPRWDIFSAGIVLAEMLVSHAEGRDLMRGAREEPPRLPESAWRPVLERAVHRNPSERPPSARSLAQSLEEVTLRVTVAEDRRPYPGLSSFQTDDAEFFFGREGEVEEVWKKLQQPHLLGLIGPSGAGKSSFLRAGLLSALPEGWRAAVCTPGSRPLVSLAQSLAPQLAGDAKAMGQMVRFEEPDVAVELVSRWKGKREGALVVVDQFEELFTLNPPEVQAAFAELLGRLPLEADVHVLLSMRDDFLLHCKGQLSLMPLFSDLTPLLPPSGSALRRALVQPALKCGYKFEDENLADEMLAEVRQERGALPLLAFAVSRLWEGRDRDRGLLTREAYEAIGGVAGALAQHAELTLERIGAEHQPLVRELFRNLVTAHGTRAVRGWEELLEVFGEERSEAEEVLRGLVDARLLTTYEEPGEDDAAPVRRVEIIHESLLSAWPRLVRWRTQDEDSAQLRDQLRMAAQMWEERGRPGDLLWTGTSFREYQLWRERYPGGLSAREEEFGTAMVQRAGRQRRRRRIAISAAFVALMTVLAVVSWQGYQQYVAKRQAKGKELFALGQLHFEANPTLALAYAIASLEHDDDPRVRIFAEETLWRAPTAISASRVGVDGEAAGVAFSGDGRLLASGHFQDAGKRPGIRIWSREGGDPRNLDYSNSWPTNLRFGSDGKLLVAGHRIDPATKIWSVRDGELLHELRNEAEGEHMWPAAVVDDRVMTFTLKPSRRFQSWPLRGGDPTELERLPGEGRVSVDASGSWVASWEGRSLRVSPLGGEGAAKEIGTHDADIVHAVFHPDGERLASIDTAGEVRLWSRVDPSGEPLLVRQAPEAPKSLWFDAAGERLAIPTADGSAALIDLTGPPDADPLLLRGGDGYASDLPFYTAAFDPDGRWLVTGNTYTGVTFWPLAHRYPYALRDQQDPGLSVGGGRFLPDGSALISMGEDQAIREFPLTPEAGKACRILYRYEDSKMLVGGLDVDPTGRYVLVGWEGILINRETGEARKIAPERRGYNAVAFGPEGRRFAMTPIHPGAGEMRIPIIDVESGEVLHFLDAGGDEINATRDVAFLPDGRLLAATVQGLRLWDVERETYELLTDRDVWKIAVSADGRHVLASNSEEDDPYVLDLETGEERLLETHHKAFRVALDPTGTIAVTKGPSGVVNVGPITGEEPFRLKLGPAGAGPVDVSPDGRWIASNSRDGALVLWPMPEGRPLGSLSHEELLATLRSLTNLRIVESPETHDAFASGGFTQEFLPFPGWETVPTW